jgi:hypothetical protein
MLFAIIGSLIFTPVATAAPPEFLARITAEHGAPGSGAAEADNARGIAGDPDTGHVYVGDYNNARVDEYTAWGLFVKSWGWGVADGSAGLQICGPVEPEDSPDPSLCQKGIPGTGKGQISPLGGIDVDEDHNLWVADLENRRVQKFTSAGEFLLMLGGDVNKTKVEEGAPVAQRNVCPVAPADVCQAGTEGAASSQLSFIGGNVIAYSPAAGGAIVVGDIGGIQIFDLDGTYREEISFTGGLAAFAGGSVNALDVDSAGNIYFSVSGKKDLYKISSTGAQLAPGKPGESKFEVEVPLGITVDHAGNVYAIDDPPHTLPDTEARIVKFDSTGDRQFPTQAEEQTKEFFPYIPYQGEALTGIATNICVDSAEPGSLYVAAFKFGSVSYVDAYGSPPIGCEDPPPGAPVISDQFAVSVGSDNAKVRAQINPKFWPDTTYYVEYGESPCSSGGCTLQAPAAPALLTEQSISKVLTTEAVSLTGLKPATKYHYRFVAQSGGGGPVFGRDPDGDGPQQATFELGLERTFKTPSSPPLPPQCSNDAFRKGSGAHLPDCRAYEMVSPLEKEGGDVALWIAKNALFPYFFEMNRSAPSGDRFAFSSAYSFADPAAAPFVSQYLAKRGEDGWASESISPPRTEIPVPLDNFEPEFQRFSVDLCTAWLRNNSVAPLTAGAIPGFPNLYRRDNCVDPPQHQALTTEEPPNREPSKYVRLAVRGISEDGTHSVFTANDKLHGDAPVLSDEFEQLLYEKTPDDLRFVCYLSDGTPSPQACGAGTTGASVDNAISADGSRIFWTAYSGVPAIGDNPGTPGHIYARVDGLETIDVSGAVASDPAWYWTAADDGSKVVFTFDSGAHKDELYEFDVDSETATLIAAGVEGPMGASEDASRIYLASTEDLDDTGPAAKGTHNLYLYEADPGGGGGDFTFVMALAGADVAGSDSTPAPIDKAPSQRAARVTPDGLHVTFSAVAPPPSGYDNLDAESGAPAQEVYRYDAEEAELACVSCNPTGARPVAEDIGAAEAYYAAARIQGWEEREHAPRVVTDDGSRVFFESFEALVLRDTNGTWDVYQWEELGKGGIGGKGGCTEERSTFSEETGGCIDLISTGNSPAKSTFLDADPSGDNIFFSTQSSLVGADFGLNDVYVARVGGGFAERQPILPCPDGGCQRPAPAPVQPTPGSSAYHAPAPSTKPKPRRCPKGKRKVKRGGKVRCVKKRKGAKAGRRGTNRRAGR